MPDDDRFLVIERDTMTGWERPLDNMAESPWGDTFTREQADAEVAWRQKHITGRYAYEVRPVTAWLLDITTGDQHDLFMRALDTGLHDDLSQPPRACVRKDGSPGALVWAYTRKGVSDAPEWLVKLCAIFEDAGFAAGIRRP